MSETSDCAIPDPPKILHQFLLKFWSLAQELHGPPAQDFAASKSAALQLFQVLKNPFLSEDEATHSMRRDREGTLSVSIATADKAIFDGWVPPLEKLPPSKTVDVKLDGTTFVTSGALWFFRKAIEQLESRP